MFCVIIIKEMGLFKANEGREWKRKGNGVQVKQNKEWKFKIR